MPGEQSSRGTIRAAQLRSYRRTALRGRRSRSAAAPRSKHAWGALRQEDSAADGSFGQSSPAAPSRRGTLCGSQVMGR
jgi:hypothetical protein